MDDSLDRLMVYRNFLAAEDHLDELISGPKSPEELRFLMGIKEHIELLRDGVMPAEVNKEYHCLVKHISMAYEGCRELAKSTHSSSDRERAIEVRNILIELLEKLWGRKIITCERCKDGKLQEDGGGDDGETSDRGQSSGAIQGASPRRVVGILSSEDGISI